MPIVIHKYSLLKFAIVISLFTFVITRNLLYICEYTHRIYSCKYLERDGHQRQNQNDHGT